MNMTTLTAIFGTIAFVLIAVFGMRAYPLLQPAASCTDEAKICPDGSTVARTGPNCEFAACPDSAASSTASSTIGYECNADGKICPDGTMVGRTGPACEFTACPPDEPTRVVTVALSGVANVRGESIRPLELIEDSRCPVGVNCIWAGTVKIKVVFMTKTGDINATLTLGEPFDTKTQRVTLTGVTPVKNAGDEIAPGDYRFTFEFTRL